MESRIVQDLLKLAKVVPVYKIKYKQQPTNYCSISLLRSLSKVLEKAIYCRLYKIPLCVSYLLPKSVRLWGETIYDN